jgi:hypothetical protein
MTQSGFQWPVGDKNFVLGDQVWTHQGYVFGYDKRSSGSAYEEAEKSGILIASNDGHYALINKDNFTVIKSGTFKHWPTMLKLCYNLPFFSKQPM